VAHHLEIRVFKGRLVIGAMHDFPGRMLGPPTHIQRQQALSELRGHAEALAALRRWPRTAELFPGSRGASDSQLCRLVEQAVERRRAVLYLVNDIHPVAHVPQSDGYEGWGAGAPGLRLQAQMANLATLQADAAVAGMSPRQRVILALGESANHMGGALEEYMSDLIRHGALPMIGFYLFGLIAANVANPLVGGILDAAIVLFVVATVGVQGAEALKVLAEAIAGAARAKTRAQIDASAKIFAQAIVGLGGTVFLAWLLRRVGKSGSGGKGGEIGGGSVAAEETAVARSSTPAPSPSTKKILEPDLKAAAEQEAKKVGDAAAKAVDSAKARAAKTQDWFEEVAREATKNAESKQVILGQYAEKARSYEKVAEEYKSTYFQVDNWEEVTKGLSQDEIWRINETFLTQQIKQGKEILFSHNPLEAKPGSFFEKEATFLKDLGYEFKPVAEGLWKAVR
jgi:hypothetical protein